MMNREQLLLFIERQGKRIMAAEATVATFHARLTELEAWRHLSFWGRVKWLLLGRSER